MGVKAYKTPQGVFYKADFWVTLPDGRQERMRKRRIPTREMALAFERKMMTEAFEGRFFERPKTRSLTVAEAWENYEPVMMQNNRDHTTNLARARHLVRHLGKHRAEYLTQKDVDSYVQARRQEPTRSKQSPMPGTLNREVGFLRRILSYGVKRGDLARNPLVGVEMLEEHNTRNVVVDEADFDKLYDSAEAHLKPILLTAYDTGMRKREILDLTWSRVDLREGHITLGESDTKTNKARRVYLTRRVLGMLEKLPRSLSGYVFVNPKTGKPWVQIKKMFDRARKEASLERVWFHDLRRSFVTNARKRGVSESVVMRMSGHRTRSVFDRYNIVDDDDLRTAVTRIEEGQRSVLEMARGS